MTRARGLATALLLACTLAGGAVAGASGRSRPAELVRASTPARNSPCDHPKAGRFTYHWPIKPFDRQHPIRGNFGDPRTISAATFGEDGPGSIGLFSFHNGVDISASTGTPVYPVVSGTVKKGRGDTVIVVTRDSRIFQYIHIRPNVHAGQHVVAYKTILGTVRPVWHHVHLTEIDGLRVHNPVDPGHLEPYEDHTVPRVDDLIITAANGVPLDPTSLHGKISIVADAEDQPALKVFPNVWSGFPVTPALVSWRIVATGDVTVVPERVAADFRHSEQPRRDFWRIYDGGTYQNFPQFDHYYYYRHPGLYLFRLTKKPLDTRQLPNGTYGITVDVADVCGNRSSLTQRVNIANGQGPTAKSKRSQRPVSETAG